MLIFSLLLPLAVGGLSAWLTYGSMEQYGALIQPPIAPPSWVFPVVWTVLYLMMGLASYLVWRADVPQEQKRRALLLYGVQLAMNFIWPLLFFRAGMYAFALLWLLLLLLFVLVTMSVFSQIRPLAARLFIPYVLWLLFAAYLNAAIWFLNR